MTFASSPRLGLPEFIALMGMMFATVAFSIDAMLPAMGEIAADLSPGAPNRAQLIITSFVLGMGVGTLFTGPLSDTFGRRPVILGGAVVYIAAALLAFWAQSLELVLAARVLQGLGAAGPRVAALALVRDLYEGRQMARVISFCMIVFTLVPAIAPLIGAGIIWLTGWRGIFVAFIVFSLLASAWLWQRQPETLAPENRRPFRAAALWAGVAEVLHNRQVVLTIATLSLTFGMLFATLSTAQPVFDVSYGQGASFAYWFGFISLLAGSASFLNAHVVLRLGMRRVIGLSLAAQAVLSAGFILLFLAGGAAFAVYVAWVFTLFFMAGLTIGNLNALGMEPLGHLAGLAASVIGSLATIAAVAIAIPVGLAFDGTPLPHAVGVFASALLGVALMRAMGPGPAAD